MLNKRPETQKVENMQNENYLFKLNDDQITFCT